MSRPTKVGYLSELGLTGLLLQNFEKTHTGGPRSIWDVRDLIFLHLYTIMLVLLIFLEAITRCIALEPIFTAHHSVQQQLRPRAVQETYISASDPAISYFGRTRVRVFAGLYRSTIN